MRTYVHEAPGAELTCAGWIEALRGGRSFVTNGPQLTLSVNERLLGDALPVSGGSVRVRARARSITPFDVLEIIRDGEVVASASAAGSPAHATLELDLPVVQSGWLAARCRGQGTVFHRPANQRVFAHTSPVYVEVAGRPIMPDVAVVRRFAAEVDRMLAWCRTKARCATPAARERLAAGFVKARAILEGLCS